jgi:hypothetical protein
MCAYEWGGILLIAFSSLRSYYDGRGFYLPRRNQGELAEAVVEGTSARWQDMGTGSWQMLSG